MLETIDTSLLAEAQDLFDETVTLRRHLHQNPELGLDLPDTQAALLESMNGLKLETKLGTTTSGIVAMIDGDHDGPTMLLRADMDALDLHEDADIDFSSKYEDRMHACGHDLHVSMLAGAAKLLHARRKEIHGRVLLMFQPGEEGFHGARYMLEEGLLSDAGNVDRAFAIHVTTNAPTGWIALKPGSIMASADQVGITVMGRGGHASSPHFALDPIPVACEIVLALQTMITRRIDAFDPGVITVGQIHAGTRNNIIPEKATIDATIRAVSEATRTKLHDGIQRVAEGIASAHGAEVIVNLEPGYPVTVNNDHVAAEVERIAGGLLGENVVRRLPNAVMGAEDFSYVLQKVPGAMAFLGATPHGINPFTAAPNHSNRARFDEACMTSGIALYAAMALDHLSA